MSRPSCVVWTFALDAIGLGAICVSRVTATSMCDATLSLTGELYCIIAHLTHPQIWMATREPCSIPCFEYAYHPASTGRVSVDVPKYGPWNVAFLWLPTNITDAQDRSKTLAVQRRSIKQRRCCYCSRTVVGLLPLSEKYPVLRKTWN